MLESQTQLVGLGLNEPRSLADDGLPVGIGYNAPLMDSQGVLNVCLCGHEPDDQITFGIRLGNWHLCRDHNNAVKLESLNGLNVMLYGEDENGNIRPIKVKA